MSTEHSEELVECSRPYQRYLLPMLCVLTSFQDADLILVPSTFYMLQKDLGLTLGNLATMCMLQSFGDNLSSPVKTLLADRGSVQRKSILCYGVIVQGITTILIACSRSLIIILFLSVLKGVAIAGIKPVTTGIIAESTTENNRGKAFSAMKFAAQGGFILGSVVAVNLAGYTFADIAGWRISFFTIGFICSVVGIALTFALEEPPRPATQRSTMQKATSGLSCDAITSDVMEVLHTFRLRSVALLVPLCILTSISGRSMHYRTLFFQLKGLDTFDISMINTSHCLCTCVGVVLGGFVADSLFEWSKRHGRALAGQATILFSVPSLFLLFMVAPPHHTRLYYGTIWALLGVFGSWCETSVILPSLTMLVRGDRRSTTLSAFHTIDSCFSIVGGNLMVSFLAEDVFGYDFNKQTVGADPHDAKALGEALCLTCVVPQMLGFCFVCLLHWSMPRDLKLLEAEQDGLRPGDVPGAHEPADHPKLPLATLLQQRKYRSLSQDEMEIASAVSQQDRFQHEELLSPLSAEEVPAAHQLAGDPKIPLPTLLQSRKYGPLSDKEVECALGV